ncbi:unnamed protein product [Trichogramma brassicae]|uniref:Uncharacterized protein n=1 Tax=Trichogramma brassicae TaxID=86971 RepID=A0A6H5I4Z8_9HYME|nr:unnamed protein product [Trichogramma brassicae]
MSACGMSGWDYVVEKFLELRSDSNVLQQTGILETAQRGAGLLGDKIELIEGDNEQGRSRHGGAEDREKLVENVNVVLNGGLATVRFDESLAKGRGHQRARPQGI